MSGSRILAATLAGAVALAGWTAAYWMTVGTAAVGVLPDETPVTAAIREHVPESGAYFFPGLAGESVTAEQLRDFDERHRRGPIGMLIVHEPGGGETFESLSPVKGLALALATSALITLVIGAAAAPFGRAGAFAGRGAVALLLALAAALGTHGRDWNQFHLPGRYSAYLVADVFGGWLLAGLIIAAILPRHRVREAAA